MVFTRTALEGAGGAACATGERNPTNKANRAATRFAATGETARRGGMARETRVSVAGNLMRPFFSVRRYFRWLEKLVFHHKGTKAQGAEIMK
jgi:hypothetical protein